MAEVASRAFCVRPANDRALDPVKYADTFRAMGVPAEGYATVAEGVRAAAEVAEREGKALLCLGSLYMYGEVRAAVYGEVVS
jgi:folylpolyglutamate synthase/dihydropteroate synthase